MTALMVAADKGYQSIVEALLEGDVDVNYKEQVGYIITAPLCDTMIIGHIMIHKCMSH